MSDALPFAGAATPLGPDDITGEAAALGCDAASVHAVCDVESGKSGFLPDRRPKILFEAHSFHTLTRGQFDADHPNISAASWDRSLYGAGGAHQYDRLLEAIALDRIAALESASWGMFQIMGNNFVAAGFADVEAMVSAMQESERRQLDAFAAFCREHSLDRDLIAHDWAAFARGYNGPGYAENSYDVKLAAAWRKWSAAGDASGPNPAPRTAPELHYATLQWGSKGDQVTVLQQRLRALGFSLPIDSDFGPTTEGVVEAFQSARGLVADGIVGPNTQNALAVG